MGRKYTLQIKVEAAIRQSRLGSPETRKRHRYEMRQFFDALATLKEMPATVEQISPRLIKRVVRLWRTRGIAENTIHTRLSYLRRLNKITHMQITVPANEEMDIKKPVSCNSPLLLPDHYRDMIYHPLTHSIIDLQIAFGLTKLEAAYIMPLDHDLATWPFLSVEANIAHNHRKRLVPILSKPQREFLENRRALVVDNPLYPNLTPDRKTILKLFDAECTMANIASHTPFRKLYAENRLAVLLKQMSETKAWQQLAGEMGFARPDKLRQRLGQ